MIESETDYTPLTPLKLEIWQREMFCKPYDALVLNRKHLLERLDRALNQQDVDIISKFMTNHTIKYFEISYCDCEDLCLKQLLTSIKHLTVLCLINVGLTSKNLQCFLNYAGQYTLKVIRLTGNLLSNKHCNLLREFLIENRYIEYLDVGFCSLTHSKLAVILDGVYYSKSLKGLDISRIVPEHEFNKVDTEKICVLIAIILNQNKIEELHVKHCGLNFHDIDPILEFLQTRNCLKYLGIGSNNIGPYGAEKIFKAINSGLCYGNSLNGLDISNNYIGKEGGEILVKIFPHTQINYLDIGRNNIPSNIMLDFLESICKPYDVKILNIFGNELDHLCAKTLNRYLQSNIFLLNNLDINVTFDRDLKTYLIMPQKNIKWSHNERYHRIFPFHQHFEWTLTKKWKRNSCLKEKCDSGTFIDPVLVDALGQIYLLKKNGEIKRDIEHDDGVY